MIMYEICAQTDPGLVRRNNEDAIAFDLDTGLCLLADGMGGYNAGEVASAMAVAFINSEMGRWLGQAGVQATAKEVRRAMEICVENANHAILHAARSNAHYEGMGTTLVMAVFQDNRLMLGNIGDSRCYRLRGAELVQITKDHSLLQEQVDAGLITSEQALTSLNRNLITRALGVDDEVLIDIQEHRLEPGDIYLMCSDGLSDMVGDAALALILREARTLEQKKLALVEAAKQGGGRDNISVLLVQVTQEAAARRGLFSRMLGNK